MGKLDSLKIDNSPLAFASFAAKHNALVDLLAGMVGENGVSVVMAERNAIIRGNVATSIGNSNVSLSSTANVVGSNGLLQNVYVGSAIPNAYPTVLKTVNAGANVEAYYNGLSVEVVSLAASTTVLRVWNGTYEFYVRADGKVVVWNSGASLVIDPAQITSDMTVREIDVCDAGVAKKMLVIASGTY